MAELTALPATELDELASLPASELGDSVEEILASEVGRTGNNQVDNEVENSQGHSESGSMAV